MHSGVDEAVLAALSDADRAAVLAAMSGGGQADAPMGGAPAEGGAPGAEEIPKFDCQGSTDQLQVHSTALLLVVLFFLPVIISDMKRGKLLSSPGHIIKAQLSRKVNLAGVATGIVDETQRTDKCSETMC